MKFVVKIDIDDEAYDLFKEKYSAEMSDDLFMEVLSIRLGATLSRMSRYLRSHNRCITVERWGTETTAITVEEFAKVVTTQLEDRIVTALHNHSCFAKISVEAPPSKEK